MTVDEKWVVAVRAFAEGFRERSPIVRRAAERLYAEALRQQAVYRESRADWLRALPWYRRWWETVRGDR